MRVTEGCWFGGKRGGEGKGVGAKTLASKLKVTVEDQVVGFYNLETRGCYTESVRLVGQGEVQDHDIWLRQRSCIRFTASADF